MTTFTLEDLIEWSSTLPDWKRDALRRILEKGDVTSDDVTELVELAKAPYRDASPTQAMPAEVPSNMANNSQSEAVSLAAVRDISRVNALSEGPIRFSPSGLTVIYGANACGKSSLTRVLKKACRSLVPGGPILPSLDDPEGDQPPSATIDFTAGGKPASETWTQGQKLTGPLKSVNVFDAECALAQVSRANEISFKPAVLRVLELMVATALRVSDLLKAERKALGHPAPEIVDLTLPSGTAAATLVGRLSHRTPETEIVALCSVGPEERERYHLLRRALGDEPADQRRRLESRISKIEGMRSLVAEATHLLSGTEFQDLRAKVADADRATKAAEAARVSLFESALLPGIGTPVWRELWESARRYSTAQAYPDYGFPATQDGARCVLCQQELQPSSSERLRSFEQFVTSDLQQRADQAVAASGTKMAALRALVLPRARQATQELEVSGLPYGDQLREFLVRAKLRRRHALRQLAGPAPPLPTAPGLDELVGDLRRELTTLEKASTGEGRDALVQELNELSGRLSISQLGPALTREVERLTQDQQLDQAIQDCDTRGLTRKAGEVAEIILSGKLRSEFSQNLSRLRFSSTGVQVTLGKGSFGSHPYELQLMEDPQQSPDRVLSEGEATCVALAGFFAELDATNNRSGVVLDDPVTSLDHNYRSHVAKLIVEKAQDRQIIVLTHDVTFLWLLRKHSSDAGLGIAESTLERGHKRHGVQKDGPPFVAMTVSKRIKWLRNEIAEAKRTLRNEGRQAYERRAEFIYGRMRKTWERAVEERLLNKVVERFGVSVQTQRMGPITDITEQDIRHVTEQMSRCSEFMHDQSGEIHSEIPDPECLEEDLEELDKWVTDLRSRGRRG